MQRSGNNPVHSRTPVWRDDPGRYWRWLPGLPIARYSPPPGHRQRADSRRLQTPQIFPLKNISQNILRNQTVALIFAANRFRIKSNDMRRDIFQAIADPTRRAIITLIAVQAMTPNVIADNFQTTRQSVSKHLRILTECQLVKQEQKGREIYYSLEIEKMKEIDKWIDQFRKIWETRFNQLDKVLSTIKKQKK
jgi:DNA-binding transcriptional ArsR family regulator